MDHGELNIPLRKRGDIDRQLDSHKAQLAATAKRTARENAQRTRELRAEAKQVIATMPQEQLARIAQKAGLTVKQAAQKLKGLAYYTPAMVVALKNGEAS